MPAQMRQHPRGSRVLGEQTIALAHQLFERRKARPILVAAIRIERQLEPPFVLVVQGLKELGWIRNVDEDRNLQVRGLLPYWIQLRIVELQPGPVCLLDGESKTFHDFANADRAGFDVSLELCRNLLTGSRADVAQVE